MKHVWLTALLLTFIGLATLAIASEPNNSHPADGEPLLMLDFKTQDFAFTDVEIRDLRDGNKRSWSLKGFLVREGAKRPVPFSAVVSADEVTRANQRWNFSDERSDIVAVLKEIGAVTHFDLAPIDTTERTVLIENVHEGMSGQVKWSRSFQKRFPELLPGARSAGHASVFLANAFFTFIEYPEQLDRGAGQGTTFEECLENAEKACGKRCSAELGTQPCIANFNWQTDGSCAFTCLSFEECCGAGAGG